MNTREGVINKMTELQAQQIAHGLATRFIQLRRNADYLELNGTQNMPNENRAIAQGIYESTEIISSRFEGLIEGNTIFERFTQLLSQAGY